jgi:hypothetical protein
MKLFPVAAVRFSDSCQEYDEETKSRVKVFNRRMEASDPAYKSQQMLANANGDVFIQSGDMLVLMPRQSVGYIRFASGIDLSAISGQDDDDIGAALEVAHVADEIKEEVRKLQLDVQSLKPKKR